VIVGSSTSNPAEPKFSFSAPASRATIRRFRVALIGAAIGFFHRRLWLVIAQRSKFCLQSKLLINPGKRNESCPRLGIKGVASCVQSMSGHLSPVTDAALSVEGHL